MPPDSFDPQHTAEFDQYADSYEELHADSLKASGEGPQYFAEYKQRVLERLLGDRFEQPVLDFGCGIGNLTVRLAQSFPVVHGYDPARECADVARRRAPSAAFFNEVEKLPRQHYGAVVLANVLHHIPPAERPALMRSIEPLLARGGRLVVFEHNPLNPLTRRVVAICKFDVNAQLLYAPQITRLLRESAGLSKVGVDYIVFFPHSLRFARPIEPRLAWLPLGAQICAFGTKPG